MSDLTTNIPITTLGTHTIQKEYRCYTRSTRFQCDYTWTIQNFKLYVNQEQQNEIKSSTFSVGEGTCKWLLLLYTPTDKSVNTALHLKPNCKAAELDNFGTITGEWRCSIINSKGEKKNTCERNILINSNRSSTGISIIKGRSIFTDDELFPRGELTIHCSVSYIQGKGIDHVSDQYNLMNAYLPSPMEDFGKLFNNQELSDVTIHVGDEKYPAHKIILAARSSVFKAMFTHDMKEKQSNRIDINDIDEKIFLEVLRYLYTGNVKNKETVTFELLLAADKYDLAGLKKICENELCRMLAEDTAVKILLFSSNYNLQDLKTRAIHCVKMNLTKFVGSDGWNDLVSQPDLLKSVLEA